MRRKGYEGFFKRIALVFITVKEFNQKIARKKYDIIHINTAFDKRAIIRDFIFLNMISRKQCRVFLKFHGSQLTLLDNYLYKKLFSNAFSNIKALGVLSEDEKRILVSKGYEEDKIHVTKNIINPSLYLKDSRFRKRFGIPENIPILLFISRFIPAKGLLDVIKACIELNKTNQNFCLLCVGDGPEKRAAVDLIE